MERSANDAADAAAWAIRRDNFRAAAIIFGKNRILHRQESSDTVPREVNLRGLCPAPYRIYEVHARRRLIRLVLIRENDADVIRTVKSPVEAHDVEIMEGTRVVARLHRSG
jgi:hypothetical protein